MKDELLYNDPDAIYALTESLGNAFNPFVDICISRHIDGEVAACVGYTDYQHCAVTMGIVGFRPRWGNRKLLAIAFDYPFRQLLVDRVFARINERNTQSLGLVGRLGFKPVAYIPKAYVDGGMVVTCMEKHECKWLALPAPPRRVIVNGVSFAAMEAASDGLLKRPAACA